MRTFCESSHKCQIPVKRQSCLNILIAYPIQRKWFEKYADLWVSFRIVRSSRTPISTLSTPVLASDWHPIYPLLSDLPRSPVSRRTISTALSMLALSVTLSRTVFSLGEAAVLKSVEPLSVRHAAIT